MWTAEPILSMTGDTFNVHVDVHAIHMIQNFGCGRLEKRVMYEKRNILDPDRNNSAQIDEHRVYATTYHECVAISFFYDSAKCESYDYLKAIVIWVIRCARCTNSLTTSLLRRLSRPNFCVKLDVAPCVRYNAPWSKKYNVRIVVNR